MIHYTIQGRPPTKKNSQRLVKVGGRLIPIPSKAYKEYEAKAFQYLQPRPERPIEKPVELSCLYFLPRNKNGTIPKNCPDLVNLLEATQDILVHYGILADDNSKIIKSVDGSRVFFTTAKPFTVIEIRELEEGEYEDPNRNKSEKTADDAAGM